MQSTWTSVADRLRQLPWHTKVRVDKPTLDPIAAGAYKSTGVPRWQLADYRLPLPDGSGLHIRDYGSYYVAHLDRVDPSTSLIGHVIADMPVVALAGILLIR